MEQSWLEAAPASDLDEFSALVSEVYDTVLDRSRWPEALDRVAHFVRGRAAGLYSKDAAARTGQLLHGSRDGISPEYARLYFETYVRFDPSTTAHYFMDLGNAAGTADLLDYEEFKESRFYREWAVPQGLVDFVSTVVDKSASAVTMVGVFRSQEDGLVDDEARRRLRMISPHLRRAVLIGDVLDLKSAQAASLAEMTDAVRSGMVLVDGAGRIVHANAAALAMIDAGDVLAAREGHIVIADSETDRAFRDLFAVAGEGDRSLGTGGIARPVIGRDGVRYSISLLPLTSGSRLAVGVRLAAVAMLFVHRAEFASPAVPELIAKSYTLTPSELRVLLAMVEVGGPSEVAETLGIAESTVRFHLRSLFQKTQTHRQAELVKLVAGFASPLVG